MTATKPGTFAGLTTPKPGLDAQAIADAVDRQTAVLARIADALEKLAAQKDR